MKIVVRITGQVDNNAKVNETLSRMRLRRKYSCVLINETPENMGMIKSVRNFVAYGDVDEKILKELIQKRGKSEDGTKIDIDKVVKNILENKSMKESGIKPFFRLHPPLKGINSKQHFPRGVLGDHKEKIKDLIRRML